MMTTEYKKFLPRGMQMNPVPTRPYWEGTKRHELMLPYCRKCAKAHWNPREQCPFCMSSNLEWIKASGNGRLWMYTVVYQPMMPVFNDDVPYVNAVIALDEGPHMVGILEDVNIDEMIDDSRHAEKINMPVEAVFKDVHPDWTLVHWRPRQV
jgi:hypothetical protein